METLFHKTVDRSRTKRRAFGNNVKKRKVEIVSKRIHCIDFNEKVFNSIIKYVLTELRIKIELYEVISKDELSLSLLKKFSPGGKFGEDMINQLLEDDTCLGNENPSIMCIKLEDLKTPYHINAGIIVKSSNLMHICEWVDNEQFSHLESILIHLNVAELLFTRIEEKEKEQKFGIMSVGKMIFEKICVVLKRANVSKTIMKRRDFKKNDFETVMEKLNKLLNHPISTYGFKAEDQFRCLGVVIDYLNLLSNVDNRKYFVLEEYKSGKWMNLDCSAIKALHLLPSPTDQNKDMSLYGILNRCETRIGSRRLVHMIRRPSIKRKEITNRLKIVEALQEGLYCNRLRKILKKYVPDLDTILRRLQNQRSSFNDVGKLYSFIQGYEEAYLLLSEYDEDHKKLIKKRYCDKMIASLYDMDRFNELCEQVINLDLLDANPNAPLEVNPAFDDELLNFYDELIEKEKELGEESKEIMEKHVLEGGNKKGFSSGLERKKGVGWGIIVKCQSLTLIKRIKINLRNLENEGEIIDLLETEKTCFFTTDDLKELGEEHDEKKELFESKCEKVKKYAVIATSSYCPAFAKCVDLISELDILSSFALVSLENQYVKPSISKMKTDVLIIEDGRHPCVERQYSHQSSIEISASASFISNSLNMSRERGRFHVITGPNMGGKSVFIRQCAIIVLMAQIGCFVPAKEARISIRDGIYCRIGSSDSLVDGFSTFYSEMLEASSILRNAKDHSLILIDELGRGTSHAEGGYLAMAISHHILRKNKSFCLFTTHFNRLCSLATTYKNVVENHFMDYVINENEKRTDITLNYKIRAGICDESFGIDVAKISGFPEEVLRVARKKKFEYSKLENEEEGGSDEEDSDEEDSDDSEDEEEEEEKEEDNDEDMNKKKEVESDDDSDDGMSEDEERKMKSRKSDKDEEMEDGGKSNDKMEDEDDSFSKEEKKLFKKEKNGAYKFMRKTILNFMKMFNECKYDTFEELSEEEIEKRRLKLRELFSKEANNMTYGKELIRKEILRLKNRKNE